MPAANPQRVARVVSGRGTVDTRPVQAAVEQLAKAVGQQQAEHPYGLIITETSDLPNPASVWRTYLHARDRVEAKVIRAFDTGIDWLKQLQHPDPADAVSLIATSGDSAISQHLVEFVTARLSKKPVANEVFLLVSTQELLKRLPVVSVPVIAQMLLMHVSGKRHEQLRPVSLGKALPEAFDGTDDDGPDEGTVEWRAAFIKEVPTWTAKEVCDQGGRAVKNTSALATRWASEGKIFAVKWDGKLRYPTFQFRHGEPRAVVARILKALGEDADGWDRAFFFTTPNAYLKGARPVDKLDERQLENTLVQLAERHAHPADAF